MLVVHFVVVARRREYLKFDLADAIIGSGAAIVGPAASAGIAIAKGWKTLITPGITIGMFGYVDRELRRYRDLSVVALATHVARPRAHGRTDFVDPQTAEIAGHRVLQRC